MAAKTRTHKIRARMKDGMAEIKLLLQHPMETGNRTDPATEVHSLLREYFTHSP